MSIVVKAKYENGNVKLQEPAPTQENVPVSVIFPDNADNNISLKKNEIKFGSLAGKIAVPENFDDPLDEFQEYEP
ncbi:hypothetical protein [Parafilimonas sp.]|jgi:hypothetical protein